MSEERKYIIFRLDEQSFGVDVQQVISIERLQEITKVPRTSDFIKGVTELRGETTPVIDLKERLQIVETEETENTRILVVSVDGMQVGMIVDAATEVKDIHDDTIQPAPKLVSGISDTFIKGVAKVEGRLLILLDFSKVIDLEEKNQLAQAAGEEV